MAYITVALVQSEFKSRTFGSGTALTSAEVGEFITQTENYVNLKLGQVYTTPITDTEDVSVLKTICTWFLKHRIEPILKVKANSKLDSKDQQNLYDKADKMLNEIVVKKLLSSDTSRSTVNSPGIEDFNAANSVSPTFDIAEDGDTTNFGEKDFW